MRRHPVAGTYAGALLAIGLERQEAEAYGEELCELARLLAEQRDLRVFFESPKIPLADKLAVLDRALTGKVSGTVLDFWKVLLGRGRQGLLGQIAESYGEALDDARGRTKVHFKTARPLAPALADQLVKAIAARLGREVVPSSSVDESLLGGMTIRIGDTVIDGSLRTRLNRLQELVAAPRIGSELFT